MHDNITPDKLLCVSIGFTSVQYINWKFALVQLTGRLFEIDGSRAILKFDFKTV